MFSGTPTSDNWARLAGAAAELHTAIAAQRSRKPTLGSDPSRSNDDPSVSARC